MEVCPDDHKSLSLEKLEKYQIEKLKEQIAYAKDKSPFFAEHLKNVDLNEINSYGDLGKAMEGVSGQYKILMSHDPSLWRAEILGLPDGIDLTLSGHTHAMQFSLPGWSPSALLFDEYRGLYTEGEQSLYVNIGLGETFFTARIGAVPEITVLNLTKK